MKKIVIYVAVFVIAAFIFCAQTRMVFAGDDLKMYNFFLLKHRLSDKVDVFLQPDIRSRDDIGELYYYHARVGLVGHANKNLDLGLTYRFVDSKNTAGDWLEENRIEIDIKPKVELGDVSLENRGRLEYRDLKNSKDRWRYRNLVKLARPARLGEVDVTAYISEEIFYDFEIDKMHLNWATVGVDRKVSKDLLLGLFYRNEATRVGTNDEWDTNHILGTKAVVSF